MMRAVISALAVCLLTTPVLAANLADLVEKTIPSVCKVTQRNTPTTVIDSNRNYLDEYFKPQSSEQPRGSTGTCFVIEQAGVKYMVTNHHVIRDAEQITVEFHEDLKEYDAYLVASDETTDIAVLSLEQNDHLQAIPALRWADSDLVRKGQTVWAVGHPLNQTWSVAQGVVSHEGRRQYNSWQELIQSDVAINQGNSGGPLLDMQGRVVAVNTLIFAPGGGSIGISFSVSSNVTKRIVDQLVQRGTVSRAVVGFTYAPDGKTGSVRVVEILPGSGAESSGLLAGDEIVSLGGTTIRLPRDIPRTMDTVEPGEVIRIEVKRKGAVVTLTATTTPG